MGRIDRLTNGVVIGTVTTAVVIILVIFIATERRVFIQHQLFPMAGGESGPPPPEDVVPPQPWSLVDRQAYLSHDIVAPSSGKRHPTRRLPRHLVPVHYSLELQPQLEGKPKQVDTFRGHVDILVNCTAETDVITLHASPELELSLSGHKGLGVTVRHSQPPFAKIKANHLTLEPEEEFLQIHLAEKLRANESYSMSIAFRGKLGTDRGFYKYHYRVNGTLKHLLLTFFEPTFARRAFPCFDEPDFKATFTVTIVRPEGYTALSTMPVEKREERSQGFVADTFAPTMPMSTYTLAFAVLNFSSQSNGNVTIWSLTDRSPYLQYALEVAPKLLKFYEDLLGVAYPLPKMDIISLPSFLADAMENWGLLTFHEQCLLYDERSTPYKKPLITGLIAHEIAHQWFGNLVTMNWWSDLWLNEGFATYMQYTGADYIQQQWRMMDLFVVNEMQPILRAESTVTAHPVAVTSNSTHHLDALFDRIVYSKASSVIRMMAHFLTPEVFMRGVKTYLHKYRFKNVKQEDLLHELTSAQGDEQKVSVKRVMKSWLKTPGYPLLTVTRNYSTGTVVVRQEAYATRHDTKAIWNIPVTYTTMSEKNFDNNAKIEWLNKREGKLKKNMEASNQWLIVNIQRVGYYRVNYDIFNWRLLQSQLREKPEEIHVLNRAQLIDDALDLAKNGHLPYEIALEFLDLVRPEDDYMPWKSALDGIHDLDFLIRKTKYYRKYQVFVRFILNKKFEAFTQERSSNLSATDDLLRKSIIMNSCYFENEACLAFSTNKFRIFLDEPSKIQKALRKNPWRTMVVLCQGVRLDNGSHWQFVLDHLDEAATDESKRAAVRALGCAKDRSRLKELLNHAFDKPEFPGKMQYIFESLMETPMGEELASGFLLKNLKKLIRKYGTGPSMKHAIRAVVTGVRSVDRFNKIKHFHEDLSRRRRFPRRVDLAFVGALTEAERALLWTRNHGRQVEEWLDKKMSKYPFLYEDVVRAMY
ncbi:hypothetical protein MRX96_006638 [Rhipicephalus microplus]